MKEPLVLELSTASAPKSVWQALRPILLVSIGLHAALLAVPMPEKFNLHATVDATLKQQPKPLRTVALVPLPKPKPKLAPVPKTPQILRPQPIAPTPQAPPAPRIIEKPIVAAPSPSPVASPTPPPPPSPSPSLQPSPSPLPSPTQASGGLPQLTDAQPACNGKEDCWKVDSSQWPTLAGQLEQQLREQGLELAQVELEDDTGLRVYQVSKDGKLQYYLSLLSTEQGAVYVSNPTLLSRSELEKVVGISLL